MKHYNVGCQHFYIFGSLHIGLKIYISDTFSTDFFFNIVSRINLRNVNLKLHFTICFFRLQLIMFTLSHFVLRTQIGFSDHAVINTIFKK